jgi:hypothetical protein
MLFGGGVPPPRGVCGAAGVVWCGVASVVVTWGYGVGWGGNGGVNSVVWCMWRGVSCGA